VSTLVSVVIPTYRRPDLLERCLAALVEQGFPRDSFEIVVADDGPEERLRRVVRHWALLTRGAPEIRYLPVTATQGPAGARNRGWEMADSPVIAFTDDDTVPHRDWIVEGYRALLSNPSALAAAGRVVVPMPADRAPTDYEKDMGRLAAAEFVTANVFVRRSALEAIGGFDERFTSAWREDSDLQFALLGLRGEIVAAPDAIVEHPVRPAGWLDNLRAHRKILFDALLFKKHPRLYRERIRRSPPWNYYSIVVAIVLMALGALLRAPLVAAIGLAGWGFLTARFALLRLRGTSHSPRHVIETITTSALIPPVAVFWRLAGAVRYRVLFL
jgi:GT2 family glycosyltransferase